ncbi:SPOR domain-containing protein [Gilvimarinus sp. SDUM040013]|uniref:SPOR domain-containing protein n=1 Tax=Gilvimarinus gilvus TaxID=3058038 RepID=A0ABU4RYB9_9GAMM|nr:SPOR domain-containing protein [Gilvimarinus sp. SDUM040013]MDO3387394.1 SPOR domain-containing protein [Gilvimarinus sp. SDUM040013]MDX6849871.1 SPOR domain-containing protein [Gilvimarinus sp. SDUM040013]
MTRDYAKKKRPPAQAKKAAPKSQVPPWVWLFIGSILGAFIMFLVYLSGVPPVDLTARTPVTEQAPAVSDTTEEPAADQQELPKPRFDFYKLLQESEEIVPATEPAETDSTAAAPVEYLLQVGSFRRAQDADNLRAQLILLNLDAYTERVTIRGGEQWHRVVVGPFDNQSRMSKARSTLVSNRYSALVLKRKTES